MPATDRQGSLLNLISIRRNQVVSMENNHEQELEEVELFQKHVANRLAALVPSSAADDGPPPKTLLSIAWFRDLLDVFLCCEAEFKALLTINGRDPTQLSKPPLDRLIQELMDRAVKALDICNAITQAVDLVCHWQKLAEIAVSALEHRPLGEGQVRRAKKALNTLLTSMAFDDRAAKSAEHNWSFGRRGSSAASVPVNDHTNSRPFTFFFPKSWSSAKQIQSMTANLVAPRGSEPTGLVLPVYIMSTTLIFVMWALVAALPCHERNGLATHFAVPKQLGWGQPIIWMQEKIGEEWKKKDKKGTVGLLLETRMMEKVAVSMVEFTEAFQFPVEAEKADKLEALVAEMAEICKKMNEGLGPLQQEAREVFHRIVRSRADVLNIIVDQVGKPLPIPVLY